MDNGKHNENWQEDCCVVCNKNDTDYLADCCDYCEGYMAGNEVVKVVKDILEGTIEGGK